MPGFLDDLEKIIDKETQAPQGGVSGGLPSALPASYDDPDLAPRLATTDEGRLIEYKIRSAAKSVGFDPHVAAAVGLQESGFRPDAVSPTNVKGPMQVSGIAARDIGMDPKLVRSDVDANIQAGVQYLAKHGLEKYPDPKVRGSYVASVNKHAERSRSHPGTLDSILDNEGVPALDSILGSVQPGEPVVPTAAAPVAPAPQKSVSAAPAMVQGAWEGTGGSFVSRKLGLDKARKWLDEHVPDIDAIMGKLGVADLKYDKAKGEFYHSGESKPAPSASELRAAQEKETAESIKQNPGSYKTAKILGFMAGPGKAISAVTPMVKSALLGGAIQGATGGAGYEAITNLEADAKSVAKSAAGGAAGGAVLGAASKVVGGVGRALTDYVVGKRGMGQFIEENFGPTLSKASLKVKNAAQYAKTEAQLQDALNKHSDVLIDVKEVLKPADILHLAVDKAGKLDHQLAEELFQIAIRAEQQGGKLNPGDLNILKRLSWDRAFTENGMRNSETAKIFQKIGTALRTKIEDAVSPLDNTIKGLNMRLGKHISLRNALDKLAKSKPGKLRVLTEAGTALAMPQAIPALLAGRAATSIPGGTGLMAAGDALQSPALIQALLGAFKPNNK